MEFSPEQNLTKDTLETSVKETDSLVEKPESEYNLEDFENRINNATPETLNKVWNALKIKGTIIGVFGMAVGAYLCQQAFGNEPAVVQNIIDSMKEYAPNPDPEKILAVLLATKAIAGLVLTSGILTTFTNLLGRNKTA